MRWILTLSLFCLLFGDVKDEIVKFYKAHYPTIEIISIKSNIPFPKKYKNIDFKLTNYKFPSSNIIVDKKYYFFRLDAKIGVYVAQKVIKKNEPVLPYAKYEKIPFKTFYSPPLYKITPDLIASKVISKNSVINRSNTKIKPAVLKGDVLNVVFKDSFIEIYTKGEALQDSEINQSIKIKINGKIYNATVVSPYKAVIK